MLIGDKVILEEIAPENVEQMRQWRNQYELRRWFREYKDITKDTQQKWYSSRGNNSDTSHIYFQIMGMPDMDATYPAQQRIDNRYLIGCCGLLYINWQIRSAEFSIYIMKDRGSGRGREALALMCDWGFKELNLHKIWAEVYDGNKAIDLYRNLGFRHDGMIRHSHFKEGKYGDSQMLSVLENEWRELHGNEILWKNK